MAQIDLKNANIIFQDGTPSTPNRMEVTIGEGNLTYSEKRNIEYTLNRGLLDEVREGDEVPVEVSIDFVWDYIKGEPIVAATAIDQVAGYGIGDVQVSVDAMSPVPSKGRTFVFDTETATPTHTVISATASSITFTPALASAIADGDAVTFFNLPSLEDALKQRGNAAAWISTDIDACRPYAVDILVEYDPGTCGDTETITLNDFRYEQLDHDLRAGTLSCSGQCNVTQATVARPSS